MTIEEALGDEVFDPSSVTEGVPFESLDASQRAELSAWCDSRISEWSEVRGMLMESWRTQERLNDSLKHMADAESYRVQAMVCGSASLFAGASDLIVRRIAELKRLKKMADGDLRYRDHRCHGIVSNLFLLSFLQIMHAVNVNLIYAVRIRCLVGENPAGDADYAAGDRKRE